ncbi:ATP-binding protein [Streptomyces sp. NPDC004732]|uniref:ATP-binding protein n=1 Tax=Streptomyces sp. NPDC004732 TaxID=3154290 RepID=UPI0033B9BBBA
MAEERTAKYQEQLLVGADTLAGIRDRIQVRMDCWGLGSVADEAKWAANELLTNVPQHTGSAECELTMIRIGDTVRVVVSDASTTLPRLRPQDFGAVDGRGLAAVAALADRWGAEPSPTGKDVWFELRVVKGALAS